MKPITKLYLRVFLISGLTFGISKSILDLVTGEGASILNFLFLFIFFGFFMSIFLVTMHRKKLEKLGVTDLTDESLKVHQSIVVSSDLNKNEVLDRLQNDPLLSKMKFIKNQTFIESSAGISWRSWGEIVKIEGKELSNGKHEYKISSSPKVKFTLIDYGKNYDNVNKIKQLINNGA